MLQFASQRLNIPSAVMLLPRESQQASVFLFEKSAVVLEQDFFIQSVVTS
jgi:hypothetical protein